MAYPEEQGFTIIELMIVVLILGVIAGVAIPSIRGIVDEATLDEGVYEVVDMLRYARNQAIQENTSRLVECDPVNEKCSLLLGYVSSGVNLLSFDNTYNPPGTDAWGVRNVKVTQGTTVLLSDTNAYGYNIPGGDMTHADRMDYTFNGSGQKLKLAYSVYDTDTDGEVVIYLNSVTVKNAIKSGNNKWSGAKTIDLPVIVTGDASVISPIDKKPFVIDFRNSKRLKGVEIVSAVFGSLDDVVFYADGTPSQGGSIVLSYKGRTKTIVVESDTGKISVQ